ncbi:MAG: O-antigen ligase family protein [Planctomycetes bacterium]|nr:O-antigen ligase family protein [Planctomycetota bacterium]
MIPFFSWQQREEGRNLVSMLITGVFMLLWLYTGTVPIVWDTTTTLVMCFGIWMAASMLWTNSRQSSQDLYMMICGLVVFLVARRIELSMLLWILFAPGVVFAAASLFYRNAKHPKKKWPIFGNPNHIGAFLLVPLFSGAWLTFNVSWWIAPLVVLIAVALSLNQCRGAQLGALAGLTFIACTQSPWMFFLLPVVVVVAWAVYQSTRNRGIFDRKGVRDVSGSNWHRLSMWIAALRLIQKTPMTGYGLRTFRREYPSVVPEIIKSKFFAKGASIESQTSHRIHNDHLEIIFELGLVGYAIFIALFSSLQWAASPLLAGAVIAFAVHGLFFFPLREAHTAYPFWALAGGMATTPIPVITINPIIGLVLFCVVCRILYEVGVKMLGLSYYDQSVKIAVAPNPTDKVGREALAKRQQYINNAIKCDPYNNIYLTEGYYYNVFDNPEPAFQYASRCMENYDGGKVKWGVADQYARALLRLGGFGVAKMAVKYALHICPDFKQSIELMGQIKQMEVPKVAA